MCSNKKIIGFINYCTNLNLSLICFVLKIFTFSDQTKGNYNCDNNNTGKFSLYLKKLLFFDAYITVENKLYNFKQTEPIDYIVYTIKYSDL